MWTLSLQASAAGSCTGAKC